MAGIRMDSGRFWIPYASNPPISRDQLTCNLKNPNQKFNIKIIAK